MGFAGAASRTSRFREDTRRHVSPALRSSAAISANLIRFSGATGARASRHPRRRARRRQIRNRYRRWRRRIALGTRRIDGGRQWRWRIRPGHGIALAARTDPSNTIEAGNTNGDTRYCVVFLIHQIWSAVLPKVASARPHDGGRALCKLPGEMAGPILQRFELRRIPRAEARCDCRWQLRQSGHEARFVDALTQCFFSRCDLTPDPTLERACA